MYFNGDHNDVATFIQILLVNTLLVLLSFDDFKGLSVMCY